jgi:putative photosynthetic complex assembly protein
MATTAGLRAMRARSPLIAFAALLLLALVVIGAVRLYGTAAVVPVEGPPVASRDLLFADRADGGITVHDAVTGQLVAELAPGSNGFIRATLRGLVRERRRDENGAIASPFRVTRWSEGRLTLEDMATGRVVDLLAFGQTQVETFQSLLNAGGEGG